MLISAVQLALSKFAPPPLLVAIHLLMMVNKTFKEQLWLGVSLAALSSSSFQAVNFLPALQAIGEKRTAPDSGKKPKTPKKKKKKDPNEQLINLQIKVHSTILRFFYFYSESRMQRNQR